MKQVQDNKYLSPIPQEKKAYSSENADGENSREQHLGGKVLPGHAGAYQLGIELI